MSGKKMFKATFVLMVVTIISKGIGFFRDALVAATFGGSGVTDAYEIAVSVPDTFYAIVGLAISTTFIPALSKAFHKEGNESMYKLANNIISSLTVISIIACIFGLIFTDEIVRVIGSGFKGEQFELTVLLTRITLLNLVLLPINSCFSAILQYKEDFIIPGILGLFFNLPIIVYLIVANPKSVVGLAIANVIGNLFRVLVQIPSLIKHGYRFKFFIDLKDKRIQAIMVLLIPVIIGAGANSINMIVDKTLASGIIGGPVALSLSSKIIVLINSVFTMSILTVVYPMMSRKLHEGDLNSFLDYLCRAIRLTSILLLPIMSGLLIYRVEIIDTFYGHGKFDETAVLLTSIALIGYAIQLPFLGVRDMLNSSFFSMEKTKTTTINSVIGVVINIVLSLILINYIGIAGISIASAVAAIVTSTLLFRSLINMTNGYDLKPTIVAIGKMIIATIAMTITVILINGLLNNVDNFIRLLIGTITGAVIYFVVSKILKVIEVEEVFNILLKKQGN